MDSAATAGSESWRSWPRRRWQPEPLPRRLKSSIYVRADIENGHRQKKPVIVAESAKVGLLLSMYSLLGTQFLDAGARCLFTVYLYDLECNQFCACE